MNRETLNRAASLVGGQAIMLNKSYDDALAGYTIQGQDVVAVYDYDKALETHEGLDYLNPGNDPEDWLLDELREVKRYMGIEPIIMRTNTNLEEGL